MESRAKTEIFVPKMTSVRTGSASLVQNLLVHQASVNRLAHATTGQGNACIRTNLMAQRVPMDCVKMGSVKRTALAEVQAVAGQVELQALVVQL